MTDDAVDVAQWMLARLEESGFLEQESTVFKIKEKFGSRYVYLNDNGYWAIDRGVLKEFRKMTNETIVWDRSEGGWRYREDYDPEGKRGVEG